MSALSDSDTVVIVDAYSSSSRLAPLFSARGYNCVHVQSTPDIPEIYRSSFVPDDFTANIVHRADLSQTLDDVASHDPVLVIVGTESGVVLADTLSSELGLTSNGTALSSARRDKYRMIETIKAAGLAAPEQQVVADESELSSWYEKVGGRVVVKPVHSAGSQGVFFCDDVDQALAAFRTLAGGRNALNLRNDTVLVQQYLYGAEYFVNTVSRDGRHRVTDIWQLSHLSANGFRDLLDGLWLLPRRGEVQDQLVGYAHRVLDALGIQHGPAHMELKLTPSGPSLVEVGARLCGSDMPAFARQGLVGGEAQLELTVDAYTRPDHFLAEVAQEYQVDRYLGVCLMISPRSGTLRGYPRLPELERLESRHDVRQFVRPGERIHRTINDFTYPIAVYFAHEVPEVVQHDYRTVRHMDGPGFYDIA